MRRLVAFVLAASACGGTQSTRLTRGGDNDEGAGQLARASLKLSMDSGETTDDDGFAEDVIDDEYASRRYGRYGDPYGGDPYGGDPYGGDPYGGTSYANWRMPQWNYNTPNRQPDYQITVGLPGAIEGSVSWNGALPAKLASPCGGGAIDNPTLRISSDKRVRGVIVYIENIEVGRATPYYTRPASVGGVLAKHGCTLAPAAQIVAPLPGSVEIHGDATKAKIKITPPKAKVQSQEIEEAGLVVTEIEDGVTRVDGDDGKLGAAWVIGLATPYFAITDDTGRYRIDELAAGTYDVTFWQPPIASIARDGTWSYSAPIVAKRKVTVGSKTAQLSVTLSPPSR
ncbi:MAG TPA: hypothetical protein VMZ53_31000 [Kofleriaceae bacterium]|nr:hypothetical protein [Kofleriaceae bacterium]